MNAAKLLQHRGWRVKKPDDVNLIKTIAQTGAVHCVDGRTVDQLPPVMRGPKIQGGVLGAAALAIQGGHEAAIRKACQLIREVGFTPAVHGDDHHGEKGCGFGQLWSEGNLSGLPILQVSLKKARRIVEEEGGIYVILAGHHNEKQLVVNQKKDHTLVPDGQAFSLDLWSAPLFGISPRRLLENAAETIERLNGPRVAKIVLS